MESESQQKAEEIRRKALEGLRSEIGKIVDERTTQSGKAAVKAAQYLLDLEQVAEARHWLKLAADLDKANADVRLEKALEKLKAKGEGAAAFKKARKGAQGRLKAVT